jgi:hypothetical protein
MEDSVSPTLIGIQRNEFASSFYIPKSNGFYFLALDCRCDDVVPGAPVTVSDSSEDASCVVLGLLNDSRR